MSHAESIGWLEYRNRHGSFNAGERLENSLASVMALMVNRTGGNRGQPVTASDFLPKRAQEEPKPISLAQAMQVLD